MWRLNGGRKVAHEVKGTGAPELVGTLGGTTALQQEARVGFKSHSVCCGDTGGTGRSCQGLRDLNPYCEEGSVCILKAEAAKSCCSGL